MFSFFFFEFLELFCFMFSICSHWKETFISFQWKPVTVVTTKQWYHPSFCCSFDLEQCRKTRGVANIQTCWKTLFKKTTTKYYGYKKYKKVQKHCWKITSDDSFWVGTVAVIEIQTHDVMSRLGERSTAASHWNDYIINRPFRKRKRKTQNSLNANTKISTSQNVEARSPTDTVHSVLNRNAGQRWCATVRATTCCSRTQTYLNWSFKIFTLQGIKTDVIIKKRLATVTTASFNTTTFYTNTKINKQYQIPA